MMIVTTQRRCRECESLPCRAARRPSNEVESDIMAVDRFINLFKLVVSYRLSERTFYLTPYSFNPAIFLNIIAISQCALIIFTSRFKLIYFLHYFFKDLIARTSWINETLSRILDFMSRFLVR